MKKEKIAFKTKTSTKKLHINKNKIQEENDFSKTLIICFLI